MTPEARIQAVRRMVEAGASNTQIAQDLGLTKGVVSGIIFRHELRGKQPPIMARECGWSDDEIERVRQMAAEGMSYSEIGAAFGISKKAAGQRMRTLGIERQYRQRGTGRIVGPTLPVAAPLAIPDKRSAPVGHKAQPLGGITLSAVKAPVAAPEPRYAGRITVCTYLAGEKPFLQCDKPTLPGKSFCDEHQRLCYHPASAIREQSPEHVARRLASIREKGGHVAFKPIWSDADAA